MEARDTKKLYYSISEVSDITKLKQYVLRYWETEFKQLSSAKNSAGNRTYRKKDIDLIINIKDLLYNKKYTIQGARSMLGSKKSSETPLLDKQLDTIKKELLEIIRIINE